jgi:chromosome segregation ATPase
MGRPGITYQQVAAAADALAAENTKPALPALRERLGTGSMNTIHRHLTAWQANRPKSAAPAIELPQEVMRGLNAWATQAATAARAEVEDTLVHAQTAAVELAKAGEAIEVERDELLDQLAVLTTARDQALATAQERSAEIARLTHDIERERHLASAAQIEAVQARLKLDAQAEQLADLKAANAKLTDAVDAERHARIKAERDAAVLTAERDAARADADAERVRIQGLQGHLDRAHHDMEALRADCETRLAAARAAADKAANESRSMEVENARLQAKFDAMKPQPPAR